MAYPMISKGKNRLILEKICFPYLPDMFPTEASRRLALAHPNAYNVEHLVEIALSEVGGYPFVDADGYDFTDEDYSDSKTCTLRSRDNTFTINKIENKVGSFRIVIYNEIKDDLDYIYLTSEGVCKWRESGYLNKKPWEERIRTRWNEEKDSYNKLEMYRVNSFVELAEMSDAKFEEYDRNKIDPLVYLSPFFDIED